jgi:hypothetical protein
MGAQQMPPWNSEKQTSTPCRLKLYSFEKEASPVPRGLTWLTSSLVLIKIWHSRQMEG